VVTVNGRIHRLDQALRQGAVVETALAERLAASEASRREAVASGAAMVAQREVTTAEVDEIAVLTSSVVFDLLVQSAGWSSAQYEQWLADRLAELVQRQPKHRAKEQLDDRE
jgi:hypothetical protein